jgi:hypothetical protein
MSVIYNSTIRTNRLTVVNDAINSKTFAAAAGAGSAGKLVVGTSALSGATGVLAEIPLKNPAATISGDVLTIDVTGGLSGTATATGTAAKAEIRNNAGTVIVSGLTVGLSGADIIVNSAAIATGQTVTVVSGTITHPST